MTIEDAQALMIKFVKLKNKSQRTQKAKDIAAFKLQEIKCIEQFRYLVMTKVSRYRNFNNYEDLVQEGMEALVKAMKSYDPNKGIFFWWLHKYIDTRIARSANLHTTIRFPLKYAKLVTPHREAVLPVLIDHTPDAYAQMEQHEIINAVHQTFKHLTMPQKQVVQMLFGINGEKPKSVAKICKQFKIPRAHCAKMLDQIFDILKTHIQL